MKTSRSNLLVFAVMLFGISFAIGFAIWNTVSTSSDSDSAAEGSASEVETADQNGQADGAGGGDNPAVWNGRELVAACPTDSGTGQTFAADSPLVDIALPCLGVNGAGAGDTATENPATENADAEIPLSTALAGKPTVLNVWAWNCGPCREEIPLLTQWAAAHPDVNVVGIHASASAQRGLDFLAEVQPEFTSFQDSHDAIGVALALPRVVPITVVLDENGHVVKQFVQAFDSYEELDAALNDALNATQN